MGCSPQQVVGSAVSFDTLHPIDEADRVPSRHILFPGLPYRAEHIVLSDTLMEDSSPEEVEALVACELGHWKLNHALQKLTIDLFTFTTRILLMRFMVCNSFLVISEYTFCPAFR